MNILITICARGGSKGIPGKNIKPLNGKPLIAYSIKTAKKIIDKYGGQLALSTDCVEIKDVANEYGLPTTYTRPASMATDTSGKIEVIGDLLKNTETESNCEFEYIIDLDVTSPLRTLNDIEEAFEQLTKNENAVNIFSVSLASRNPYFNMVEVNDSGFAEVIKKVEAIKTRQSAPKVYDMNASFYIYKKRFFKEGYTTSTTDKSLLYIMNHECFDIDRPIDFTIMELMLRENLLDIEI